MACTLTLQTGSSPPVAGDKSWEEMNLLSSIKMSSCSLLSSWAACRPAAYQLLTLLEGPTPVHVHKAPSPLQSGCTPQGHSSPELVFLTGQRGPCKCFPRSMR